MNPEKIEKEPGDPQECPSCGGTGKVKNDKGKFETCKRCSGKGWVHRRP